MTGDHWSRIRHPVFTRRNILQAGGIGLLGLSLSDVQALQVQAARQGGSLKQKSVIYIFLSGGVSQHDSFDPKPDAPADIRGEFKPIATKTPGVAICEHLPKLAQRSDKWALVRSLSHGRSEHSAGHHIMLTGSSELPPAFNPGKPQPSDFPSLASVAGRLVPERNGLPSAAVLPYSYIHHSGRIVPGQFAGQMGPTYDPWTLNCAHNCPGYGACPNCIDFQRRPLKHVGDPVFQAPNLRLPEEVTLGRMGLRRDLLEVIDSQRRDLDQQASVASMDRYKESALSLLLSEKVRKAFDIHNEDPRVLDMYGRNLFGWSCLMARRLVEIGVSMIQVNLGRNESWDTHGNAFPILRNDLFPPMDQCVSALMDDLESRGLLDSTLIVMAGEFGRTPKIATLTQFYELPGRDHWGPVQSLFLAGGGIRGGTVVGKTDKIGAFPTEAKQTPENMASTIYHALGLGPGTAWRDAANRPHFLHRAEQIPGLM